MKSTLSVLQSKGISFTPCFISSASHLLSGGVRPAVCIGVTQQQGGAGQGGQGKRTGRCRKVCVCVGRVLKHTLQHTLGSWSGLSCKSFYRDKL